MKYKQESRFFKIVNCLIGPKNCFKKINKLSKINIFFFLK